MRIACLLIVLLIAGCVTIPAQWRQALNRLSGELQTHQVYVGDPVFMRVFKEENILELWMKGEKSHQYTLVKTYPICKWSGALGPKFREGDLQSPEGFYSTNSQNLNPNSKYHLSFNVQYPNVYDRLHKRTGSFLMVHGDCVSEGCYAMSDPMIEEIYVLTERALDAGQLDVPVHIFPFKMTSERMAAEIGSSHFDFWMKLKTGYDYFEQYGFPPRWEIVNRKYDFY
jgi:murein L,D-transpeptidase YafK